MYLQGAAKNSPICETNKNQVKYQKNNNLFINCIYYDAINYYFKLYYNYSNLYIPNIMKNS